MQFEPLDVTGAFLLRPERRADARGWFARVFSADEFAAHGLDVTIAQINLTATERAGTVRGLHYQLPPAAESKLVRCTEGAIFDVVVDSRPGSPTFGRWAGAELSAEDGVSLYVPAGCAHGYQALVDGTRTLYHASVSYSPQHERGIDHADPQLAISWPLPPSGLSEKDASLPPLSEADLPGQD
ncbi:dTDP-4-dehydrorhamnose 3,5-epimerase [Nitriliruptor alkaliphilus]|uniref:dTDP-4-dehydrorhamnose 3,5-epimerase n=1 Tax=Nitriliruptor alkaliphilus TaxID=427918 RepID=UPI00069917D5|nr:dTDP-4-dehydrorhamnose 3,5-epimerase [Nitriliruptor alkaliphilus]